MPIFGHLARDGWSVLGVADGASFMHKVIIDVALLPGDKPAL